MPVLFHDENADSGLRDKKRISEWLKHVVEYENASCGTINLVFTDDESLRKINQEYLERDYYTDIITFDLSDEKDVSADLFISIERVKENASRLDQEYEEELRRVMVHGVLHVLGQDDQNEEEIMAMRQKEDFFLSLYPLES